MKVIPAIDANKQTEYYIREKIITGIEESIKKGKYSFCYNDVIDENILNEFRKLGYVAVSSTYLKNTSFHWRKKK